MYNILKKEFRVTFQFMKLTKINGRMGTHTLENHSKAQPTLIILK
jgi:hypothetical protein